MKGKNIVLTVAIVAACAGSAMAAPTLVKSNMTPTRIVPTSIAPVYVIDGVEVIGEEIPYSDIRPSFTGRRVVFDQYDGDQTAAADYPPINRGGPCGGAGFLYTANTNSSSSDYFHVRVIHSTDDWKGMDPFGIGKPITSVALLWNHATSTEGMRWIVRGLDNFNELNSPTFNVPGPRTRTYSGTLVTGVQVTYNGAVAVAAGFYYSMVDWAGLIVQPALLDTDGAVNFQFLDPVSTLPAPGNGASKDQVATWGTRADELPAPSSLARPGGQMNPFWYIDDAGALKATGPYILANAAYNNYISPAGADGGPNETYTTGPSTNPADCFRSIGPCWALFVGECVAADAATLVSPANGATGVANPVNMEWAPGAIIASDYEARIYLNNVLVFSQPGIITTTFVLNTTLADCTTYQWAMFANAGAGCPGTESQRFTFTMSGTNCCRADFNRDGVVDFFDYLDFVDAFSANAPAADFNGDGVIDFFDYLDFVDAFAAGC